jgi:ABC-type amino acid transport substrate-binding protein
VTSTGKAVPRCAGDAAGGCGATIPRDPDGTLDDVRRSGVLRAGASPAVGWVELGDGRPAGLEPDLVESYADDLGVRVEWVVAGEEHLVTMLEDGSIDVAVGGFTKDNAWVKKVALLRPYVETKAGERTEAHVMMVPMGENAWQSALERWLDRQEVVAP